MTAAEIQRCFVGARGRAVLRTCGMPCVVRALVSTLQLTVIIILSTVTGNYVPAAVRQWRAVRTAILAVGGAILAVEAPCAACSTNSNGVSTPMGKRKSKTEGHAASGAVE